MHTHARAALFTRKQRRKQAPCPPIAGGTREMGHMHTVEYYSALGRNDILIHVTTGMKFENMLNQTQKDMSYDSTNMRHLEQANSKRKQIRSYQVLEGVRIGNYYLTGIEFGMTKKFWRGIVEMVAQYCKRTSCH